MARSSHTKSSEHGTTSEHRGFILGADVDGTLLPVNDRPVEERESGYASLDKLTRALRAALYLLARGTVTGRTLADHDTALSIPAFRSFIDMADFKITSVGTRVHLRTGDRFEQDVRWPHHIEGWQPHVINEDMIKRPELIRQPAAVQNEHKVSYYVLGVPDAAHSDYVTRIEEHLTSKRVHAQIIFSGGEYLDFLPIGVHKGSAFDHVISQYSVQDGTRPFSVAAGNSMNDWDFLQVADLGIITGNADISLRRRGEANPDGIYIADQPYAAGVLEGLQYAGTAGLIDFPA